MCKQKIWIMPIFALLVVAPMVGCSKSGDEFELPQLDNQVDSPFYEGISVADQQLVRSVLNKFTSKGNEGVNVGEILELIENEGLRNYPDNQWIDDFFLSNVTLDLTQALPENDLWGDYDPDGGAIRFQEITHDEAGEELSNTWVSKQARHFSAGTVEGFTYRSVHQNDTALSTVTDHHVSFSVSAPATLYEDAWNAQQSYTTSSITGLTYNEQYAYQTAPSKTLNLHVGSAHSQGSLTIDTIHHGLGWTVDSSTDRTSALAGTLTLYQPSVENAEANARQASEPEITASVKNNIKTSTVKWTSVDTVESYAGPNDILVRRETTTHTYDQETRRDASSGALFGEGNFEHITTKVSFHPREGSSAEILERRALEEYRDYTVTTRVLGESSRSYRSFPVEQVSCAIGGTGTCPPGTACTEGPNGEGRCMGMGCPIDEKMWGTTGTGAPVCSIPLHQEETVTTYRYTDNPATRHDVEAWKSTRTTFSRDWNEEKQYVDTVGGAEWLTDQIVADPEFDAVPFVWDGTVATFTTHVTQLLDSAGTANESSDTTTTSVEYEAGWGGNIVSLKGSYSQSSSSITGAEELSHANGGNALGSISLGINGSNHTISAEQWLDQIAP